MKDEAIYRKDKRHVPFVGNALSTCLFGVASTAPVNGILRVENAGAKCLAECQMGTSITPFINMAGSGEIGTSGIRTPSTAFAGFGRRGEPPRRVRRDFGARAG